MEEYKLNLLINKYNFVVGIMKLLPESKRTSETFIKLLQKYATFKNKTVQKSSVRIIIDEIEYAVASKNTMEEKLMEIIETTELADTYENEVISWDVSLSESVIKNIIIKHFLHEF